MPESHYAGQNAVVYCRVSSAKQATEEKGSLDAQEANGLRKAAELGVNVVQVVKDPESAWVLAKRTKFRVVLNDARAGKFTVLIIDRMNRFVRAEDLGDFWIVRGELRDAGVEIVFSDRQYEDSLTGQLVQSLDAYVSAMEQVNRRKQSLVGKQKRAKDLQRPIPGSWPVYGYRWADEKKTRLVKDDGEARQTVERIWQYFLTDPLPTLRGMATQLNDAGTKTPREYAGVKRAVNAVTSGPRWTAETVAWILRNPLLWGGDGGKVTTFRDSAHYEPVSIPAYAPPYVTPGDAARVHALIQSNRKHLAHRQPAEDWGLLLRGGLVRCGECGWGLEAHRYKRPRRDGSLLTLYRCPHNSQHGKRACGGVALSAEVLDYAVEDCLDRNLARGPFLENLFAAWDRDAEASNSTVRAIDASIRQAEEELSNLAANLATMKPGTVSAASVHREMQVREELLESLRPRRDRALAAVAQVQGDAALREELRAWFAAWCGGFGELDREHQRRFLRAIHAVVLLWREGEHDPRAELRIALPTDVLALPEPPAGAVGWALGVDVALGEEVAKFAREFSLHPDTAAQLDSDKQRRARMTTEEVKAAIQAALAERGYDRSPPRRTSEKPRIAPAGLVKLVVELAG